VIAADDAPGGKADPDKDADCGHEGQPVVDQGGQKRRDGQGQQSQTKDEK
jgi:hypothetical protein